MKTYKKDKFEDSDIREALAEKFHYPIEDIRRDGYGFAVTYEVKEQEEKENAEPELIPIGK